jgi:hypothetical protein
MTVTVSSDVRRKKAVVGLVAIALLLLFTVLALMGILSALEWIIADIIVAAVANIILRRIGRPKL